MELKKSDKANLEKNRGLFGEIGLILALGFTLVAFEWKVTPTVEEQVESFVMMDIEEEIVPITRAEEELPPPPPEPPKITDLLEIVADDVFVDTSIDINIEADQSTEIAIIIPTTQEFGGTVVEEEEEEVLFAIVEDKPLFNGKDADIGFREYVSNNTQYPPVAQENGISGKIIVEFAIGRDGAVTEVKVLRGVDPLLDNEALRVIRSSPKWTPGMQRGKPVKVKYQFPVNFQLNN